MEDRVKNPILDDRPIEVQKMTRMQRMRSLEEKKKLKAKRLASMTEEERRTRLSRKLEQKTAAAKKASKKNVDKHRDAPVISDDERKR